VNKKELQKAIAFVGEARSIVEQIRDDEQNTFDEKSDTWKESDKGSEFEANIETLSEAVQSLEDADTHLEDAMKYGA
jgi:hypothetical protein